MSASEVVTSLINSAPSLVRMSASLFWAYLTLGWRVRRARKAFENQLILQGMSKDNARRLGVCYNELKESIVSAMKQGMIRGYRSET